MKETYIEGKSVGPERFVRTLKNKIFKHMAAVFFYFLDHLVDNYNNTYHRTIKIKPIDVKTDSCAENNVDSNKKDPKFQVDDYIRILNCKNIFSKVYSVNWPEEVFVTSKIKNAVPWTYVANNLNGEKIVGTFYEK